MMWLPERVGFKCEPSPEEFSAYVHLVELLGSLKVAEIAGEGGNVGEIVDEVSNAIFLIRKRRDV